MTSSYACDCVWLHMHVMCVLVCVGILGRNSFKGGKMTKIIKLPK